MKGIFKKMKGKLACKKGSSLIAVMTTMAVLSIVALCAAGIALTNYRTTKTYTSQDNYYYSAEAGQAQFVANMTDAAYSIAANFSWSGDDAYSNYYQQIKNVSDSFQSEISETLYNGEYKVQNEIVLPDGGFPNESKYAFTIKTTVTNDADGTSQEFFSTVTVEAPSGGGNSLFTDTKDVFNSGYAVVASGSAKNNDWYGLWGGFNTWYTQKYATNSPVSSGTQNLSSIYLGESKPSKNASFSSTGSGYNKTYVSYSGIFHKLGSNESIAANPDNYSYLHKFSSTGSVFGASDVASKVDGLSVDIVSFINTAKSASGVSDAKTASGVTFAAAQLDRRGNVITPAKITLSGANNAVKGYNKYYSNTEKYYYQGTGDLVLEFGITVGTTEFTKLQDGEFYRVICKKTTDWKGNTKISDHAISYQLDDNKDGVIDTYYDSGWEEEYTYFDHYFKNKFFFIDLGGTGTLRINNRTKVYNSDDRRDVFNASQNYIKDAWGNNNGVADGNVVLEDCVFFVNGNIEIGNAYHFSKCNVFATGDITLRSVYYMEGLLSYETDAGSDIIKQSLYYCDGVFESDLISRYAMNWVLEKYGSYYQISGKDYKVKNKWMLDCLLDNGNTYVKDNYTGLLATYRYPTVLKAVIIAKGSKTITNSGIRTTDGDVSNITVKTENVSVYLNPDGSVDNVVDVVLIEGQIYAKNKILIANYNEGAVTDAGWFGWGSKAANRFAASSQIQYHAYQGNISFEGLGGSIAEDILGASSPVIVQNSGVYKK